MLSGEQHSSRSLSESVLSGSIRTGPANELSERLSHHSSISDENNNDNISSPPTLPIFPIPSAFALISKSASASKSSTPFASIPKTTTHSRNVQKKSNNPTGYQTTVHRINTNEKKKVGQTNHHQTKTQSKSKYLTTPTICVRVSAREIEREEPTPIYVTHSHGGRKHKSVFEKVDLHSGRTTFLGCGTYPQLEDCISDCLARDRHHKDIEICTTPKYDDTLKCLKRASILDDYSYDGVLSPNCYRIRSSSCHRHHYDHHKKCASELSLREIREVNDNLEKCGIPVFSHHHHDHDHRSRNVGDIVSACKLLLSDPTFGAYRQGNQAVSHVWDAIRNYQPSSDVPSYPPPAAQGVGSPPFGPPPFGPPPYQPPYNPMQPGAPNTFYPPPQQPPSGGGQSVLSRLFGGGGGGGGQQPPPPFPPPPPPQQPPSSSGQSVLQRLFGGGGGGQQPYPG
ncbi:unnamed protein product [Rotaria sordida]|uniref:Uncharacterized protein n=1 Tax=Rotaria sordida TaxID=392033 RepID=A0A818IDM7_9BILA|nr:unnamed protein product [Rotaria sordida]CAF0894457.1 unnamed protein product [Rotaria sordida]CAF3522744.1 unnamed protein product [Rotaria sordida]CAF4034231.1 unnamed protein product [Rotaria sordida]